MSLIFVQVDHSTGQSMPDKSPHHQSFGFALLGIVHPEVGMRLGLSGLQEGFELIGCDYHGEKDLGQFRRASKPQRS
jgi:hypothetical protein